MKDTVSCSLDLQDIFCILNTHRFALMVSFALLDVSSLNVCKSYSSPLLSTAA